MSPLDPVTAHEEPEGSYFEFAADFFTLISLSAIYVVIVFGSTLVADNPIDASTAVAAAGSDATVPLDPDTLLFDFRVEDSRLIVDLVNASDWNLPESASFSIDGDHQLPVNWGLAAIDQAADATEVVLSLSASSDDDPNLYKQFMLISADIRDRTTLDVSIAP